MYRLGEGTHIVRVETGVEAADTVDGACERLVLDLAFVAEVGAELVGAAQTVEGGDGGDDLHG